MDTIHDALKILQSSAGTRATESKGWEFFRALLGILGSGGMSSEESDVGEVAGVIQKVRHLP
jgi:hypothetical protein